MKSKGTTGALVEEVKINVVQCCGRTEKGTRSFLSWLEKLEHFDKVLNDDQRQCPEKLAFRMVRLHGSRWRKAHLFAHMNTLTRQRYQLRLKALNRQRNQLRRIVLFGFMPLSTLMHVRMD